jgi:AcrR family transcriptional regulator
MAERVKRTYDNSRRLAAARATKAHVVAVAMELFVEQGYPATTISQIARRSDTPEATLYRLFGSKRGVLKEVLDVAIGGDDEQISYKDRAQVQAAFAADDPGELIDAFAHLTRQVLHRSAALLDVLMSSAGVDPEAAEMLSVTRHQRHTGQSRIVQSLARSGHLRNDLTPAAAKDIVYALMSPELYRILTIERRWPAPRYERWLATTLRAQLLAPYAPADT